MTAGPRRRRRNDPLAPTGSGRSRFGGTGRFFEMPQPNACKRVLHDDTKNREKYATQVDWETLGRWLVPGGFRIEDDILVTDGEPINLTAEIPY